MNPHFFIDGYNVIRSSAILDQGSIDVQRERLLSFIEEERLTGSRQNGVTVVFDGKPGLSVPKPRMGMTVRFSYQKDADTLIKELVDAMPQPKNAIVVTIDKAIQRWVRGAGARVVSCANFLPPTSRKKPSGPAKKITPQTAQKINRELEKAWLG